MALSAGLSLSENPPTPQIKTRFAERVLDRKSNSKIENIEWLSLIKKSPISQEKTTLRCISRGGNMSYQVSKLVRQKIVGGPTKKLILMVMAEYASPDGSKIWPTKPTIAKGTELSESAVKKNIRGLVESGILVETGKRKISNGFTVIYRIDLEALSLLPSAKGDEMTVKDDISHGTGFAVNPVTGARGGAANPDTGSQRTPTLGHSEPQIVTEPPLNSHDGFEEFWEQYPETNYASQQKANSEWEKLSIAEKEKCLAAVRIYAGEVSGRASKYIKAPQNFIAEKLFENYKDRDCSIVPIQKPSAGSPERDLFDAVTKNYGQEVWVSWFRSTHIQILENVIYPFNSLTKTKLENNFIRAVQDAKMSVGDIRKPEAAA